MTVILMVIVFIFFLGGLYWKYFYLPSPTDIEPENRMIFELPKGPSIAVLQFDNLTGDTNQEYFCDGITEIITSAPAHVPNLFVIARNSAFSFKGKPTKAQIIGFELGVDYIIEGSIQALEDMVRITAQLIETRSGNHVWSEIYDKKLVD